MTPPAQRGLETFAPDEWFADRATSSVWISAYRVPGDDPPRASAIGAMLPKILVMAGTGTLSYLDGGTVTGGLDGEGKFVAHQTGAGRKSLPSCNWLILLSPYDVDGEKGDEREVRRRISSALGALSITGGRHLVTEHLFDNIANATGKGVSASSNEIRIPHFVPRPSLPDASVQQLATLGRAVSGVAPDIQRRIGLSLHWYDTALDSYDRDGLIKSWIALEVLGMADATNIKPLNRALAKAYGCSLAQATDRFFVGRLFGLRSRVVHHGSLVSIPFALLRYVQALYVDVLYALLNLPGQQQAQSVLADHESEIADALRSADPAPANGSW